MAIIIEMTTLFKVVNQLRRQQGIPIKNTIGKP
jgi:hypothetical protein